MSSLITLSKSLHKAVWLYEAFGFASEGDAILLIEDAVYDLQSPRLLNSFVAKAGWLNVTVYALNEDIQLRGVVSQQPDIITVDMQQMVDLTLTHTRHVAW